MIETGKILISEPFIGDDRFERSVIYITSYQEEEGTVGFILNQKSNLSLKDVIELDTDIEVPLFIGGPVEQNTLHFIYSADEGLEKSWCIKENLYWGGDIEQLLEWITIRKLKIDSIKFFLGYSGWEKDQLEEELKQKSWFLESISNEDIFYPEKDLWKKILSKKGGKYKMISNYPIDPRLN